MKGITRMAKLEKTDTEILAFMVRDIATEHSIKQLADLLKRPYVKVHSSVQRLLKKSILKKEVKGKSHYCRIDYKNNLDIVCFAEAQRTREFLDKRKAIRILMDNLREKIALPDYSLAIFGSFAKDTHAKSSDLDIAAITSETEKAERTMNAIARTATFKIHPIAFSYNDFIEMLRSKELTVGKEIAKNHILIHGYEQFYECLRLAE